MKSLSGIPTNSDRTSETTSGSTIREGPCTPPGCQRETGSGRSRSPSRHIKIVRTFTDTCERSPQTLHQSDVCVIGIVRGCSPTLQPMTRTARLVRFGAQTRNSTLSPSTDRCAEPKSPISSRLHLSGIGSWVPRLCSEHLPAGRWAGAQTPRRPGGRSRRLAEPEKLFFR